MKFIYTTLAILIAQLSFGQQYIASGNIEFEVKTNTHKSIEGNEWLENLKSQIPEFSTSYFDYTFNNNAAVYKFNRTTDKKGIMDFMGKQDDNIWYNNYETNAYANVVTLDNSYLFSGNQRQIKWKIFPNDQRVIAGFNCRKAQAVLFDSVYVFAYYTDEITISGGPMGLNGLPGMILGVTIPRLFQSWIATKLEYNIDAKRLAAITAPTKGKKTTEADLTKSLTDLLKSMGPEGKKFLNPLLWRTFL